MKQRKSRRKLANLLVSPRYQIKYAVFLALSALALAMVNLLIFLTYFQENYKLLVTMSPMENSVKEILNQEIARVFLQLGVSSVVFALGAFVFGLFMAHRTAGPLYQLRRAFQRVKSGDLSVRVKWRTRDEFQEVAHEFNQMIEAIEKKSK